MKVLKNLVIITTFSQGIHAFFPTKSSQIIPSSWVRSHISSSTALTTSTTGTTGTLLLSNINHPIKSYRKHVMSKILNKASLSQTSMTTSSNNSSGGGSESDDLTREKICVILEVTFIEACLQIATGNVAVLKLFIATLKEAYDRRIPIPELVQTLESMDKMRNSANRQLTTEEVCLRTLWLNLSYLTLEFLERIEENKAELAFDSNIDEALEATLSVSILTRGTYKHIVEEKVLQFLGRSDSTVLSDGLASGMGDTAQAAMMAYSLRIIDKTLKVVREERMAASGQQQDLGMSSKPIVNSGPSGNIMNGNAMSTVKSSESGSEGNTSFDFDSVRKNIQSWNENGLGQVATNDGSDISSDIVGTSEKIETKKEVSVVDFDLVKRNVQSWNNSGLGAAAATNSNGNSSSDVQNVPPSRNQKDVPSAIDFDQIKKNIQSWNDNGLGVMATNDNANAVTTNNADIAKNAPTTNQGGHQQNTSISKVPPQAVPPLKTETVPSNALEAGLDTEKICVILELTFIEACLQIATGNVAVLKVFIATLKEAYDRRIPIPELVQTLESMDKMRNSANRQLTTEEVCLRTLWLNLSYLTLEYLERIEENKAELAFDSNIDEALEATLSVSILTRGTYKHIVEEKVLQFLGRSDSTVLSDGLASGMGDTAQAAMMAYSLRIIDKTLKVVREERMAASGQKVEERLDNNKNDISTQSPPLQTVSYNQKPMTSLGKNEESVMGGIDFEKVKRDIQAWNDSGMGINVPETTQPPIAQIVPKTTLPQNEEPAMAGIDFEKVKRDVQKWNDSGVGNSIPDANQQTSSTHTNNENSAQNTAVDPIKAQQLSIPVHDLIIAKQFYSSVLGCSEGRSSDKWHDYTLFGHQIVCHWVGDNYRSQDHFNLADGDKIPSPKFDLTLHEEQFHSIAKSISNADVEFLHEPGQTGEQWTMSVKDPSGNKLEFNSMATK